MRRGPLTLQFNFFVDGLERVVAKVEEEQTQTEPNTGNGNGNDNLSPTTFAILEPNPPLSPLDYPQTSFISPHTKPLT